MERESADVRADERLHFCHSFIRTRGACGAETGTLILGPLYTDIPKVTCRGCLEDLLTENVSEEAQRMARSRLTDLEDPF
jgi:hypothetical protein